MSRFVKGLLSLAGVAALMLASAPSFAACAGPACGCSAISVPAWTPLPSTALTEAPLGPATQAPPWYTPAPPAMTPAGYVSGCASNINSCVSASVVVSSDPPPGAVPSWASFASLVPPTGYRTSSGCYGYGNGPCNAVATPPNAPAAQAGVTNYQYATAFPCEMSQGGSPVAGASAGAVKQFRMRPRESVSFAFTVPPLGSLEPTTTDAMGNLIPPIYRSISFSDWNNPFVLPPVKFVTLSRYSGDFNAVKAAANDPCFKSGVSGDMKYAIVDSSMMAMGNMHLPPDVCPLEAGQTYYLNARFEDPTDPLLTQVAGATDNQAAVDTAYAALQTAQSNLYAAMGIAVTDPAVIAAQNDLIAEINAQTILVNNAKAALDAAIAGGSPPATITTLNNAYVTAQNNYNTAVAAKQAVLDAAIAAAPPGAAPAPPATIAALTAAAQTAKDSYEAAVAANEASKTITYAFIQDTCEWSLCRSDQARSNVNTPMEDTYSNAYYKEWQCQHDMVSYYTLPGLQAFCGMVASGYGPVGCSWGYWDGGGSWIDGNCFTYTPVDPTQCIGNRIVTATTPNYDGDGNFIGNTYSYGFTGGAPLTDCGISVDMGCGLSVP